MQNQRNDMSGKNLLTLRIVSPDEKIITAKCDSVNFQIKDGKDGNGGGSYGIHYGHARAFFAVAGGKITAKLGAETVVAKSTGEGFAETDGKTVTVTVEKISND